MRGLLRLLYDQGGRWVLGAVRDLAPILLVILAFQYGVLGRPLPEVQGLFLGLVLVVVGLALFVRGLELGLFPLGEHLAYAFARRGSLGWLLLFAFALGVGTTVAEPAVIAVTGKAAQAAAAAGAIPPGPEPMAAFAWRLRGLTALGVGVALALGVLRVVRGWSLQWMVVGLYGLLVGLTPWMPPALAGIAYDLGGVTTSEITVPLVTALGVGLASSLQGRNPIVDGFGMVALASVVPILLVVGYALGTATLGLGLV